MGESAARQCTGHSARYLVEQQCWPKNSFSLLHFNKLDPPTRTFLMVVVSGGYVSCGGSYGAGAFALAQPQCIFGLFVCFSHYPPFGRAFLMPLLPFMVGDCGGTSRLMGKSNGIDT